MSKKLKSSKKAGRPVARKTVRLTAKAKPAARLLAGNTAGAAKIKTSIKTKKAKAIVPVMIPSTEVVEGVGRALEDVLFLDYVAKNVGSQANDVLRELSKGPRKDEQLAETVAIKLNEVRRVLNLLNKHGIVRYDVKRDSSGWLTFEWHVDYVAFSDFYKGLGEKSESPSNGLPENCNDFFICSGCKKQGILYPFDVAYEKSFKCNCGKSLEMLSRTEAEVYIKN